MGGVSAFLGLCLGIGGAALIRWIASDPVAYGAAGTYLQWLGLAYPLICLNSVLSISLIAADDQAFLGRFMATLTLATTLLFVVGIWQFGTPGLIAVFIVMQTVGTGALWFRFQVKTR